MGFGLVGLAGVLARRPGPGRIGSSSAGTGRRPKLRSNPLAPRAPQFPGQGQAGHPPVHERRPVARRHVRPQAAADEVPRQAAARPEPAAPSARPAPRSARRSSSGSTARAASRSASSSPARAECMRRHLRDPLDARRRAQPRAVADADELRRGPAGPAQHGLVGDLRPGHREPEPARLHRHVPRRLPDRRSRRTGSRRSCPGVYQGTYIDTQHTDIEKLIENIRNNADRARGPAAPARPAARAQPSGTSAAPRHDAAARGAHPVVRAGLPDAVRGGRRLRHQPRAGARSATMYGPGVQARQLLIARRLLERGVRFVQVWHGDGPALGQPRRHRGRPPPARRASATRPIAAFLKDLKQRGMLDRHAGHLGRRVRPHADRRAADARPSRQDERPRPQPLRLHHVAGRRRRQGRPRPRRHRRVRLRRPSRTRSTSTTSTPRSSTCSASTTRSSPTATPAATSA